MHLLKRINLFQFLQNLGPRNKSGRPKASIKYLKDLDQCGKQVNVLDLKPEQWLFQEIIRNVGKKINLI